ncbi:conserved protein of unknown function [Escherichia coli]|nr:conserved protein of unknown function [Escherichia coli]
MLPLIRYERSIRKIRLKRVMVAQVRLMALTYLHVICALIAADKGATLLVFRHRSSYSS